MTVAPAPNGNLDDDPSSWTLNSRHPTPLTAAADNTERTSNTYKVLLKIPIPDAPGLKINQLVDIRSVFDKIFEHNKDLQIYTLDRKYQVSNMNEFPSHQKSFEQFFQCETVMFDRPYKKQLGHYSTQFMVDSMKPISAIKSPPVYKFLVDNKIYLTPHAFTSNQVSRMAIITKKHTKITNIHALTVNLKQAIHKHLTAHSDLPEGLTPHLATQLFVKTETIIHKPDNLPTHTDATIESTVFCIYTNRDHAAQLGNYLADEDILPETTFGHWVPWTARLDKEVFAGKLREHNAFQHEVRHHVLVGVSPAMMDCVYVDPDTDTTYESCYQALCEIKNDVWTDEDGNDITEPMFYDICEAPEPTNDIDRDGKWFIPYTCDISESYKLLHKMIRFWQENPIDTTTRPELNPSSTRTKVSAISQKYITQQRKQMSKHDHYQSDQFNRGRLPKTTTRTQRVVEIDNTTEISHPSWVHMVQSTKNSHQPPDPSVLPTSTPTTKTSSTRAQHITPSPANHPGATHQDDISIHSVATTMTSNRTDIEALLMQMRHEHQDALRALQIETNRRFAKLEATLTIHASDNVERDVRLERLCQCMTDSISQLAIQIETTRAQSHPSAMQTPTGRPHETNSDSPLTDEELMEIDIPGDATPLHARSRKRLQSARTPPKSPPAIPRTTNTESSEDATSLQKQPFQVRPASNTDTSGAEMQ